MTTYAALLRGINVGGNRRVPMADLRELISGLGHRDIRTNLQSGNAVFTAEGPDSTAVVDRRAREEELAFSLAAALEERFGFAVDCLVRDHAYLAAVVEQCPFPAATLEGRQLHATYLSGPVDAQGLAAAVDAATYAPDDYRVGDRVLYLYAQDGLGNSRLAAALSRPSLFKGVVATSRNWNTVTKLVEMTGV
ncbi:hypothetical protein DSC45_12180 [Streptomyces sp. YIM 130001]|uniref:DUF1697 domain-containing protein n=1 Tax=Streptomyces sp. YIM 130001 TaxID=2259644 RepID=UPI000E64F0B8|nr:DUF1697 domain-containing protein [Streptomyces sp. YIM 130001]RII17650.1 hypothetical protein DSC45_12180 [Streptomyces sp. YIM 130001]